MLTAGEGIVQIQTLQVFKRIRGEPTGMDDDEDPKLCRLYPERREGAVGQFAPGHIMVRTSTPFCFVPNSRDIEPVSVLANQVSAKQIRIWTIREWRRGAEIRRLALRKRTFAVAETDAHSRKSLKSGTFS
jgi:hypothetical protein